MFLQPSYIFRCTQDDEPCCLLGERLTETEK
jgi:hypothetical protein